MYSVVSVAIFVDVANGLRGDTGEASTKGTQFPSKPLPSQTINGIRKDLGLPGLTGLVEPTSVGDLGMQNPVDPFATTDVPFSIPLAKLEPYPWQDESYQQLLGKEMEGMKPVINSELQKAWEMERFYERATPTQPQAVAKLKTKI